MQKYLLSLLFFLLAVAPLLNAQNETDSIPAIGGIVLDDSTFNVAGTRSIVTRSSTPGAKKSLLKKLGLVLFNQRCEKSCGSTAIVMAAILRYKLYCDALKNSKWVFSWSYIHNQLVKKYGEGNIRLKNVLDLIQEQGVPLEESFPNTPCSHDRLPNTQDRQLAALYNHWIYEPAFNARKAYSGSQADKQFREQTISQTIGWIDKNIPVIIGLLVTEDFRRLTPTNCLWQPPASLDKAQGHALVVTGYDDSAKTFELLNSFGSKWGCGGVAHISYDNFARVVKEGYVLKINFATRKKVNCPPLSRKG